jgi:alpha-amylase/alpha-mannosidase (GH57 family)
MADIALTFLWHQHQPYYPDDVNGDNPMPWVRLHGVKDYYGMALHLHEVPEMRATINLVPSLLVQLAAYTEGNASDRFLDATRIPADGLREDDALFLLDHFFMANAERMILPFPRYAELYQRRAPGKNSPRDALRRFQERDFRDLQVWFNLTWIHPLAREQDECLSELVSRGRNYSEEDKTALIARQYDILRRVLPLHIELAKRGQVELSTTPFYHPILPLLFDKKLAREALPEAKLPRYTGGYPEDAAYHVRRAIDYHTKTFGQAPRGMWPAEGSVCQDMIPLLVRHGMRWIATDEEILGASTHGQVSRDAKGHVRNPEVLYRGWKVREGGAELGIVFRDHALSDLIGFHYQRSEPQAAVDHFMGCLHGIAQVVHTPEPALVSVTLDGENCWEHYPGGGVDFLRALYNRCTTTPGVRTMTVGEYLERHPPREALHRLFAGSWISHNFAIWIGHEEDNTAWDALHRTRDHLLRRQKEGGHTDEVIARAWQEIYIAEGSDWFWWFGDDHSSAQDALFDYLFRKHLQNVYTLLGDEPPPELMRPISRRGLRVNYTQPRAFLDVKIDGRYTFFEWVSAGRYLCQNERGTMAMATQGPLEELYFGFNLDTFFVRIDCNRPARVALAEYDLWRIGFIEPTGFEVRIHNPGRPEQRVELSREGRLIAAPDVVAAVDQIAEAAIPFARLGVGVDGMIQFFVELVQDGQGRDRAPREGTIALTRPSRDFEQIMWDV